MPAHPQPYSFPPRELWLPLTAPCTENRESTCLRSPPATLWMVGPVSDLPPPPTPPPGRFLGTQVNVLSTSSLQLQLGSSPPLPLASTLVSPPPRHSPSELCPLELCMVRAALRGPAPGCAAIFLKYARPQRQGTSLAAARLLRCPQPRCPES